MAKLYVYQTAQRLVPAFRVPDEWLKGWGKNGFENTFKFLVPQGLTPFNAEPSDVLRTVPHVTVKLEKAYRNETETPVPHVVLLGGGRWLLGHREVKELEYANAAPV